jgi:hypothetical protein
VADHLNGHRRNNTLAQNDSGVVTTDGLDRLGNVNCSVVDAAQTGFSNGRLNV